MASSEGGVDIEEVAATKPEAIAKVAVDPLVGLQPFQTRQLAFGIGLDPSHMAASAPSCRGLYDTYLGRRRHAGRDQPAGR